MDITLDSKNFITNQHLTISGSKSETNRLLVLQALYPDLQIENASDSDDSEVMKKALSSKKAKEIDVHHAGTAMRFLTSYFAIQPNADIVLTGSSRMKERPIQILVDALKQLDADITYLEKEGFPPIRIKGKTIHKNIVEIETNVSSQYISSLMLIASSLPNGLKINLKGNTTSAPYIRMTLQMLHTLRVNADLYETRIKILPSHQLKTYLSTVQSDWSSASSLHSLIALAPTGSRISLCCFKPASLQGDAVLAEMYKDLG